MPKDILGLDYDDVVLDFNRDYIKWQNKRYSPAITYEQAITFDMPRLYGCTEKEIHERVHRYSVERGLSNPPIEGAVRALKMLSLRYEIHIVTSRLETYHDPVVEWTINNTPGVISAFHFTNGFGGGHRTKRRKSEVCLDIGAVALIDDSYEHAEETARGAGIPVLMPDRPWNRDKDPHPLIHRMASWDDITTWLMNNR